MAGEIQKQHNVTTVAHLTCVCADRSSIGAALTEMQAAGIEIILDVYKRQVFACINSLSRAISVMIALHMQLPQDEPWFCLAACVFYNVCLLYTSRCV